MKRDTAADLVALLLAVIIGVAIAAAFVVRAQPAPGILFHVERADYDAGQQTVECWLRAGPGALIVTSSYVSAECVSDVDGIFRNGFEPAGGTS